MNIIYNSRFTIRNSKFEVRSSISFLLIFLLLLLGIPGFVLAEAGIANKYIGDKGIENDPDVIFAENFEAGTVTDIVTHWTDSQNTAGMSLVSDVPSGSSGTRSLQMTSIGGTNTGGYLYKKLSTGYDHIYFRFYIKYASGGTYHHTGGRLGGYNPPTNWPQGGAGIKPTGSDRFSIAAEPNGDFPYTTDGSPRFDFYIYWMNMRNSSDGKYWGNDFINDPNIMTVFDKWVCVEVMVKLNNPLSSYNGELAMWIDGKKIIHLGEGFPNGKWAWDSFFPDSSGTPFEGFQWRNVEELKINWVELIHYVTQDSTGYVGRAWFDDVVVATKYIGPINTLTDIPSPPTGLIIK